MTGRKLASPTTVGGVTYPAGTVPPPEVAEKIDNPKAWTAEPDAKPEPEPDASQPHKRPAKTTHRNS